MTTAADEPADSPSYRTTVPGTPVLVRVLGLLLHVIPSAPTPSPERRRDGLVVSLCPSPTGCPGELHPLGGVARSEASTAPRRVQRRAGLGVRGAERPRFLPGPGLVVGSGA